jgi:hypothetical protein
MSQAQHCHYPNQHFHYTFADVFADSVGLANSPALFRHSMCSIAKSAHKYLGFITRRTRFAKSE